MSIGTQSQPNQASLLSLDVPVIPSSPKSQRIPALDFTKGALVLIMVLYHWVNYFIGMQWPYYKYLRFLTPSFIFITGFLISHVYLSKYSAADPRLWKRLFTRGLKLMAIFLMLNAARNFVIPVLGNGYATQNLPSFRDALAIFISGNLPVAGSKLTSFSILVPISYVLTLSGLLMLPYRRYRYTFHLCCGLLLLSILVMGLAGGHSYNLEFITIGMLGVLAGFMPAGKTNDLDRHPFVLAFGYVCYLIAVRIWNVPFLLLIVGVLLNLILIYIIGARGGQSGVVRNEIILLGKYSLLGYIAQVAILQVLSVAFRRMDLGSSMLSISFFAAFILTILSVEVVDRARAASTGVDTLYKAVFA